MSDKYEHQLTVGYAAHLAASRNKPLDYSEYFKLVLASRGVRTESRIATIKVDDLPDLIRQVHTALKRLDFSMHRFDGKTHYVRIAASSVDCVLVSLDYSDVKNNVVSYLVSGDNSYVQRMLEEFCRIADFECVPDLPLF